MSNNELDKKYENNTYVSKGHTGLIAVLGAGMVIALAGDGYLLVQSNQLRDSLAQSQESTQVQMSKLNDATKALLEQRLESINDQVKGVTDAASTAVKQARSEARRQGSELAKRLDAEQQQVSSQLTELKDANDTTASKVNDVSTDVTGVKTDVTSVKADVASTQTELQKTGTDLKRVMGDMGVMSGLIATNSKDVQTLRDLGERNYFEFTLNRRDASKKVGDVVLTLKKSDPKRNRYTVDIVADDKRVEKRDKTINEPVQLYMSNSAQPYEIVINEVGKDQVVGYLSTPKVKMARR
jgi:chromosome segregation ATPase